MRSGSKHQTDVLILCGGLGKRLRSIVSNKPKPLIEIDNRAFLDLLIEYIAGHGFKRFILCTGYMGSAIVEHYETLFEHLEILFSQENQALGTAGAIKNAEPLIQSSPFLVANGDSFCHVDLAEFFGFHRRKSALSSIVVTQIQNSQEFGALTLNESQEVVSFEEKKAGGKEALVNAGIYLFEKDVLSLIPPDTTYSLEVDLFPDLVGRGFYGFDDDELVLFL